MVRRLIARRSRERIGIFVTAAEPKAARERFGARHPLFRIRPWLPAGAVGNDIPREPISLEIGIQAITAFEAITGAAIGFESAATVGALVLGGTLIGLNYALSKTAPDGGGDGAAAINTPDSRGNTNQPAAPQRRAYGRIETGGNWTFYDDATAPFQVLQTDVARGRISAVRAVKINGNRITFAGGTPFDQVLEPVPVDGQDYAGNLLACFRQGLADQAKDPLLETYFPASGDEIVFDAAGENVINLPATFRQRGHATASFRANFGPDQDTFLARWGNVAFINPLLEIDGHPLFDPRDPSQRLDDEPTFKFTYAGRDSGRNPSLLQCNWMTAPYGGRLRSDQIRLDELADSANRDDEIVYDKDGNSRPRYQADGVVLLNQNPREVTEAMLTANQAWIVSSRGRCGWVPSRPLDPIVTITDSDLAGAISYQDSAAKTDLFNQVRTRFTPPEKDYAEDDGPVSDRPDLRDADGQLLDTTVRTVFTTDQRAVQWLAGQFLDESRQGRALDIAVWCRPRLLKLKIGSVVRVDLRRRYTDVNGIYQLRKDGYSDNFSQLTLSLRGYDRSIFSRDRSGDELPFQVDTAA